MAQQLEVQFIIRNNANPNEQNKAVITEANSFVLSGFKNGIRNWNKMAVCRNL